MRRDRTLETAASPLLLEALLDIGANSTSHLPTSGKMPRRRRMHTTPGFEPGIGDLGPVGSDLPGATSSPRSDDGPWEREAPGPRCQGRETRDPSR